MRLTIPELGDRFTVERFVRDPEVVQKAQEGTFTVSPGTYVIKTRGERWHNRPELPFQKDHLGSFAAAEGNVERAWLVHEPVPTATANQPLSIQVKFIAPKPQATLKVLAYTSWRPTVLDLQFVGDHTYAATLPAGQVQPGTLRYYVVADWEGEEPITYPGNVSGSPQDWDFHSAEAYEVRVVPAEYPIHLFEAAKDADLLARVWRNGIRTVPTENFGEMEYQVPLASLFEVDEENLNADPIYDYTFKHYVLDRIAGRRDDLAAKEEIVLEGRSLTENPLTLQVAVVLDNGAAYGGLMTLEPERGIYRLALDDLHPVKTVTLPRPYPSFLPYYLEHNLPHDFDVNRIESIQFSIGPGLSAEDQKAAHGLGLVRVWLE